MYIARNFASHFTWLLLNIHKCVIRHYCLPCYTSWKVPAQWLKHVIAGIGCGCSDAIFWRARAQGSRILRALISPRGIRIGSRPKQADYPTFAWPMPAPKLPCHPAWQSYVEFKSGYASFPRLGLNETVIVNIYVVYTPWPCCAKYTSL